VIRPPSGRQPPATRTGSRSQVISRRTADEPGYIEQPLVVDALLAFPETVKCGFAMNHLPRSMSAKEVSMLQSCAPVVGSWCRLPTLRYDNLPKFLVALDL
jgi:hypothetical protein